MQRYGPDLEEKGKELIILPQDFGLTKSADLTHARIIQVHDEKVDADDEALVVIAEACSFFTPPLTEGDHPRDQLHRTESRL